MKTDFDTLAPEARRIILVSSDAKYAEFVNQIDWMKVLKLITTPLLFPVAHLDFVSAVIGPAAARSAYLGATWAGTSSRSNLGDQSWLDRMTTRGEIPIPHLSPGEAGRRFRFDFGEPKDGSAYLLDPCHLDHYLVPAIANERLAQEKMSAFTQIAATLGAKRVEIVSGEVQNASTGGAVDVPVEEAAAQIGLGVAFDRSHKVSRQVFMEFDDPGRAPFVPPELGRWVELDPALRALVSARLAAKPRIARVNLRFEDTVDVDARITAELAERKIGVGGKYRQVTASAWSFEIEFWSAA